jgi:lipopolysaccharide transport system ATP-binding protein
MNEPVISVEQIGKRYVLGGGAPDIGAYTFRDMIAGKVRALFSRGSRREGMANIIWALRDVSFEVRQGEILGIIGRNGAGKSTLLKILAHITRPTTGTVRISASVASLLEVGTGFSRELTGRENIFLNGAILGMKRVDIQRQFDSIVAFAEIPEFLDTPIKWYSTGMYLRLAFAVAAHLQPEILLIDEVLAVGDAAFQRKCMAKMSEIERSGRTILFVSHNLGAVRTLCTRGILLDAGTIVATGPIGDIIDEYLLRGEQQHAAAVGLPPAPPDRPGCGDRLITQDEHGAAMGMFMIGQRWQVALEFTMRRDAEDVVVAVAIVSLEGYAVTTCWSSSQSLAQGRYVVEFPFQLDLAHGYYMFNITMSSKGQTFYAVEHVGSLHVSELAVGSQPYKPSGAGLLVSAARPQIRVVDEGEDGIQG